TYERAGETGEATLTLTRARYPWRIAPLVVTMALVGVLALLRLPEAAIGRRFFLASAAYAMHWTFFPGGPPWQTYLWATGFGGASLGMFPFGLRAAMTFPPESAPVRLPWWPWLFAAFGPTALTWVFGTPLSPASGQTVAMVINVAFMVTILVVAERNLRRAG